MPEDNTKTKDIVLNFVKSGIKSIETWKKEPGTPASIDDVAALLKVTYPAARLMSHLFTISIRSALPLNMYGKKNLVMKLGNWGRIFIRI